MFTLQNCIVGSTGNGVSGNSLPSKFTSLYSQWNNVQRLVGFYLGILNNLGDKIKKKTYINWIYLNSCNGFDTLDHTEVLKFN